MKIVRSKFTHAVILALLVLMTVSFSQSVSVSAARSDQAIDRSWQNHSVDQFLTDSPLAHGPSGPALVGRFSPNSAPYPASSKITGLTWAPASTIVRKAEDSDTWPLTWADDGDLYTAFGDGWGFDPRVPSKLSLGFAKVSGMPDNFNGVNLRSPDEKTGDGRTGEKASGMLMVDKTLYMWVRNANNNGKQCRLAWSTNHGKNWTWSDWNFTEFGYCAFLNFGQNYSGARDNYVYVYSPNTADAYNETDTAVLARVPKDQITKKSAYEYFTGLDQNNQARWSSQIAQRGPVFTFPGGVNRMDVTYNAPLGRYLMTMRSRANAGGLNQFSIYDAPEPWGPWTTVYYTEKWEGGSLSTGNGGWGESQHIPSKWISSDGKTFYLVFAGDDSFSVRKATLSTGASTAPTPTNTPAPIATPTATPASTTTAPTPTSMPTPTTVGSTCGPLVQEAEAASLAGAFEIGTDQNARGGRYIFTAAEWDESNQVKDNPHIASFCFSTTTAGVYRLKASANAPTTSQNSFFVQVNGAPESGYLWDVLPANGGYVIDYVNDRNNSDPVQLTLPAGQHTVKVFMREAGTRLDTLELELVAAQ